MAEAKKTVKKAAAKKAEAPAAEKAVKKPAARTRKPAVKKTISIQYAGKDYTTEALADRAKEIYAADESAAPVKTLDLYVKPEENKVYFVINGDVTGSFDI
jgi:hypothetical protein